MNRMLKINFKKILMINKICVALNVHAYLHVCASENMIKQTKHNAKTCFLQLVLFDYNEKN